MKRGSQSIMDDLFLLRRLQVIHEFFSLCSQSASGFAGLDPMLPLDAEVNVAGGFVSEETLLQPVRRFAADFVRHQLIGMQPQTIALAVCMVLEELLGVNLTGASAFYFFLYRKSG